MYTITDEIYYKMKALLASLLVTILKIDPRPHFLWWTPGHNDCVWTLVHLHYTSQFHTFQGNHQSLHWNVRAAHINNFSSNLVECIDFSDLSGATVGWSRLFVRFPKISQVMMKWRRRASHLVDLLCGTTAAELNNTVWCMYQESHAFSKEKYKGLIQSKILLRV